MFPVSGFADNTKTNVKKTFRKKQLCLAPGNIDNQPNPPLSRCLEKLGYRIPNQHLVKQIPIYSVCIEFSKTCHNAANSIAVQPRPNQN